MPQYPHINVKLSNTDGNAFSVLGKVSSALRRNKVSEEVVNDFMKEATSGDYDHVLQTCFKYVSVS